jgi:hypothetical protein
VFLEISLHRGLVVKRRDRYEGVRDHDAISAAATLTQSACNVVDFAYIHHCAFAYPQRVTETRVRIKQIARAFTKTRTSEFTRVRARANGRIARREMRAHAT